IAYSSYETNNFENITKSRNIFVWFKVFGLQNPSLVMLTLTTSSLYIDEKAPLFGGWGLCFIICLTVVGISVVTQREGYISNHINMTNLLILIDKKKLLPKLEAETVDRYDESHKSQNLHAQLLNHVK
ncbi:hypothetical protein ACJX0J_042346, partial [Zea mays]